MYDLAAQRPPGNTSGSYLMISGCETIGFWKGTKCLLSHVSQGEPIGPGMMESSGKPRPFLRCLPSSWISPLEKFCHPSEDLEKFSHKL